MLIPRTAAVHSYHTEKTILNRQKRNYEITYIFSLLSTNITFNSQQSMLDINKVMETVLTGLLNNVYGTSLINLNTIRHNHPAIDLGDEATGSAFQVTSDGSRSKFEETIEMFIKHKLHETYRKITFLVISNDAKITFSRTGFDIKVNNLSDIAKTICELPDEHFDDVYRYCQSHFSVYFPGRNVNLLEQTQRSSTDPSDLIIRFLTANDINVNEEHIKCSTEDIRNQLIGLKIKLAEMTDDQRWFIFYVMNWMMRDCKDSWFEKCYIPKDVIVNINDNIDRNELGSIINSLVHLNFAYYDECISSIEGPGLYVYYNKDIPEDFDYLVGIVKFLQKNKKEDLLKSIIYDRHFLYID